ncbi:hypothetical protein [Radiobacillus sp. PE A8.2]|uniref:hypothetical protein n=1 Tax=Radiobacillus sp. PE A8.2 TaxID=3380349 RepID=UPI00388EFF3C
MIVLPDSTFLTNPDQEKILTANVADELSSGTNVDQLLQTESGQITSTVGDTEYEIHYQK